MSIVQRPRNPYIAGKALGQDTGFFGRRDVFDFVENTIDENAIVLFGQRRIGKTSILLQLCRRLTRPSYLPIYLDLMDRANRPVGEVLFALAAAIAAELGWPAPSLDQFDDEGVHFETETLARLHSQLKEGQHPVLLLDEFDVLDITEEQRLTNRAAANSFFPYLRRLMEHAPWLRFVFVVGRKAEDLSIDVKAAFRSARYKRISVLDRESSLDLIRSAEDQESLVFSRGAVERIISLTSGHPFFTQLLCSLLWDKAYRSKPASPPRIGSTDVEAATPFVLEAGEHVFDWIWDGLPAAERVIFAVIAQSVDEASTIDSDRLLEILQSNGIRILTRELELAPQTLLEWEMLSLRDGGYGFFVEILRQWVATRKPLTRVKDELDRIVPLADNLYRTGSAFYRQGDAEQALGQLHQALRVNPNHLKARLLIASVLTEQGDLTGALRELEDAYRYDEEASRFPLVRALLVLGEEQERVGEDDEALASYERALILSPSEGLARDRQTDIWNRRGDRYLALGELEVACEAYVKAENVAGTKEVQERLRQRHFEAQLGEAQGLESAGRWDEALAIYSELSSGYPENTNIARFKQRAQEEQWLLNSYNAVLGWIQQQNWDHAVRGLGHLIYRRPDYKDAAQLLVQAIEGKRSAEAANRTNQQSNSMLSRVEHQEESPKLVSALSWVGRFLWLLCRGALAIIGFSILAFILVSIIPALFDILGWTTQ